jgi:hypothetical protein
MRAVLTPVAIKNVKFAAVGDINSSATINSAPTKLIYDLCVGEK